MKISICATGGLGAAPCQSLSRAILNIGLRSDSRAYRFFLEYTATCLLTERAWEIF